MLQKNELVSEVKKNIDRYFNLEISNQKVPCPYAINFVESEFLSLMKQVGIEEEKIKKVHNEYKENNTEYGWYRGKGTPQELEDAFVKIAELRGFNISNASVEGIREGMKLFGLGIDCSGYVYNVLLPSFERLNMKEKFIESLMWGEKEKMGVSRASVNIFAGDASILIEDLSILDDLDLLFIKNSKGMYTHIAMTLKEGEVLKMTQSVFSMIPNGVRTDNLKIENNKPIFDFNIDIGTDWNELYENGQIEFRRLRILI